MKFSRAERQAQKLARRMPPSLARAAKGLVLYPRYRRQLRLARRGFQAHGQAYRHHTLFVAGLPKSGTTWLELMLASYPGYTPVLIPEASRHGFRAGGSHQFNLPADIFARFAGRLVVAKMHVHGSDQNADLLKAHGVPTVAIYRDLRDVAVSYYYYVRQTPWHPEYPVYASLDVVAGLDRFGRTLLAEYADWVRSWERHAPADWLLLLRYEDLLADTAGTMSQVAGHFALPLEPIPRLVEHHRFKNLQQQEKQASGDQPGFFRKGTSGDWRNHFTPALVKLYRQIAGEYFVTHQNAFDGTD